MVLKLLFVRHFISKIFFIFSPLLPKTNYLCISLSCLILKIIKVLIIISHRIFTSQKTTTILFSFTNESKLQTEFHPKHHKYMTTGHLFWTTNDFIRSSHYCISLINEMTIHSLHTFYIPAYMHPHIPHILQIFLWSNMPSLFMSHVIFLFHNVENK